MSPLEFGIAWRYLRSRRGSRLLSFISLIAMLGVVVGVAALVVVTGVMNGLQHDLRERILIGSPDVRVLSYGEDLKVDNWPALVHRIAGDSGVIAAAPFVLTQGIITAGRGVAEGTYVAGIEAPQAGKRYPTTIRDQATRGDFSFRGAGGAGTGVVVGERLATRLRATLGDTVTVVTFGPSAQDNATRTSVPTPWRYQVTGVFRTGMYEYDNSYVYVALDRAQAMAGFDSSVTGIEVSTATRWDAPPVARRLSESLGYPYRTVDWQEQNSTLFQALRLQKFGMTVILLLIALVAAFTIVSNLTMVVADKTREIGILRAMGMTARSIRRVFFVQGLIIGAVGTVAGVLLGLGVGAVLGRFQLVKLDPSVYFIDHLPVITSPRDILFTMLASMLIACIATFSPARSAARLYPVEAIRHE